MPTRKWSEFEVQAVAWTILNKWYDKTYSVRGEYRLWFDQPDNEPNLRDSVRLDIAILDKATDEIKLILQVKRNKTGRTRGKIHRIKASSDLSQIPLVVVEGMHQAIHVVDEVKKHLPLAR